MFRRATTLLRSLVCFGIHPRTVLLTLLAVGIGLGIYVHRVHRQRRVVAAIRQVGGSVAYDYQLTCDMVCPMAWTWVPQGLRDRFGDDCFNTVVYVHVDYLSDRSRHALVSPQDDEFLSRLDELPGLQSVFLRYGPQSEDRLLEIGRLRRLKHLTLFCPGNLTDRGVAHFTQLKRLESLSLERTNITDESVRLLVDLPCLENLDLRDNRITNQALAYAGQIQSLKVLWLGVSDASNPSITDEGLVHLAGLSRLEGIDLEGTAVTEQGLVQISELDLKWLRLIRTRVRDYSRVEQAFPGSTIDW